MRKILLIPALFVVLNAFAVPKVTVTVKNQAPLQRNNEIVELSLKKVIAKLGLKADETFIVKDSKAKQVPYQITNCSETKASFLLFPATVKANGTSVYIIQKGAPEPFAPKVYGRLVPERKDDFTWENDRVAFRVYGPALQATGEVSSGIDVWSKRTDKLVIDKWYADELAGKKTYHTDGGEGLDMYKVGPTLGAGAAAPYLEDKLWFSKNFVKHQVLENGPLRMTVKLEYAPFMAGNTEVTETRIISLDAGNQLNKITLNYSFKGTSLPVAAGIVMRNSSEEKTDVSPSKSYFLHAEPEDKANGIIYTAVVGVKPFTQIDTKNGHIFGVQNVKSAEKYVYYQGAGWSKWGFATFDDWKKYVADFSLKIKKPLVVTVK